MNQEETKFKKSEKYCTFTSDIFKYLDIHFHGYHFIRLGLSMVFWDKIWNVRTIEIK